MEKIELSSQAVSYELQTIKNIVTSTMQMYEETSRLADIQINLDAIQKCITALRPSEE